jgi:GNAT superfamily N-acetyltransferase
VANLLSYPVGSEQTLTDWQHVHNEIIPADALELDEVRERITRYHLEVAYADGVLVACTTVRPPADDGVATVIVRVLPEFRHQGYGRKLYARSLDAAYALGAQHVETVVWEPNVDGLKFALANGFTETDRYLPDGGEAAYITLRLG